MSAHVQLAAHPYADQEHAKPPFPFRTLERGLCKGSSAAVMSFHAYCLEALVDIRDLHSVCRAADCP